MRVYRGKNRARGERNGSAKLTEDKVREIRRRCACGVSIRTLAKEYGVSPSVISNVFTRKTWGHVDDQPGEPTK